MTLYTSRMGSCCAFVYLLRYRQKSWAIAGLAPQIHNDEIFIIDEDKSFHENVNKRSIFSDVKF